MPTERLTGDFEWNGVSGHLAVRDGSFLFVTADLPEIHLSNDAEVLCHLSNDDIMKHGAGIPVRETAGPEESQEHLIVDRRAFDGRRLRPDYSRRPSRPVRPD